MFKQTLLILFSAALTFALVFALSLSVTPGQADAANLAGDTLTAGSPSDGYANIAPGLSATGDDTLPAAPNSGPNDATPSTTAEEDSPMPPALRSPIVQFAAAVVCILFAIMAVMPLFVVDRSNGL